MPRTPVASLLQTFLADPARPVGTLRYHELQGFLFTIASAPVLVPPSDWLPMIFDDKDAGYRTLDEAQTVLSELLGLYNSVNETVLDGRAALPADCALRRAALANLEPDAPVAEWSRGFLLGHQWLEDTWEPYIPEEMDEEFGSVVMTLSFFSSMRLAQAFSAETKRKDLPEMARTMRRVFGDALFAYASLGRSIHEVLAHDRATRATRAAQRRGVKAGRKYRGSPGCG